MPLREVLTWPNPRLREVARPVEVFDESVRALVEDMFETMYEEGGVGLAATQVGVPQRVVVIDCGPRDPEDPRRRPIALINPEIVEREGTIVWREGCLSLPGLTAEVERSMKVAVRFRQPDGAEQGLTAEGLFAVVVQHEIDHLEGQLYVDRLGVLERKAALMEYAALTPDEQALVVT